MRYIVTPSFSEKVVGASPKVLSSVRSTLNEIESSTRDELLLSVEQLLEFGTEIYLLKRPEFQILISFGTDSEGEYALLADLIVQAGEHFQALPSRDPNRNSHLDPRRNVMINPTQNVVIDPRRNVMIDPRRNVMIDPRRNVMIDPRRNVMIDPRRNVMIDPRRNPLIDPRRNTLIDPRRNTAWDGPYMYDLDGTMSGFLVRASDKVALLFDRNASYVGPVIAASENYNIFDTTGNWTGYLVNHGQGGFNRFDTSATWCGFSVGEILAKMN